jgi:aspartate/methionine/tyrosine aminotransferase
LEAALKMKHRSMYLDWYVHAPELRYDLRSSGTTAFKYDLTLTGVDLSVNYAHGNPETTKLLAQRYHVQLENVFISSEGASGQNARIIRCLAERSRKKNEAIVEYPTYEPLLRLVQEYFPKVKRLERREENAYVLDADLLRKGTSDRTGLLVITNPHAPSGAVSGSSELEEIMNVAREREFHVLCDEIYAEFDRAAVPTIFSADSKLGIVTTSFSKAYGLGGLKLGIALAESALVDEIYADVLNTVGNSPNVVQLATVELLTKGKESLERHKQKWMRFKNETEKWMDEKGLEYFPNRVSVTYWMKLPVQDTCRWVNEHTIKHHSLAVVPGAFFLFREGYELSKSCMIRLGLGNVDPDKPNLDEALKVMEKALKVQNSTKLK